MKVYKSLRTRIHYPIKHLSVDSDAGADLVKIYGLTWMKYLGIRTSLVTMHAVGQRRRNYDVTIARHPTLRSHAWRITGGSRHALTLGHLERDFKGYCRGDYSRTHQGRAITRYASSNKAY